MRLHHKVQLNANDIDDKSFTNCDLVIFGSPKEDFSNDDFLSIQKFLKNGGSVLFLCCDGSSRKTIENANQFLKEYGVMIGTEAVIRSSYFKYLHPKHVYISDNVLQQALTISSKRRCINVSSENDNLSHSHSSLSSEEDLDDTLDFNDNSENFCFVFPNGVTIDVQQPSTAILSSGPVSFPGNRPIASAWEDDLMKSPTESIKHKRGRMIVMGSSDIFNDKWLEKEQNGKLFDIVMNYLLHDDAAINFDKTCARLEFDEKKCVPNISSMAHQVQSCLQEGEILPQDINELFCEDLFQYNNHNLIPETIKMYDQLNVKHEPLSLILPEFECPLPSLQPACFPPRLRELQQPSLDQFDLDEHFADERIRLAQLANKCIADDDIIYFVEEAKEIINLGNNELTSNSNQNGNHILSLIFQKVRKRIICCIYLNLKLKVHYLFESILIALSKINCFHCLILLLLKDCSLQDDQTI